jgi:nucleoside-diphosphate-sugar epimerase
MSGNKKRILITGASGFLGSSILEKLVDAGYPVLALRREESDLWRCSSVVDKVHWVFNDDEKTIGEFKPEILLHSAWIGVEAAARNNWDVQLQNVSNTFDILKIADACGVKRIISFGSQAEYGRFEGRVDEEYQLNPHTAYGAVKCNIQKLIQSFCERENHLWIWLRLFSVFGPKENSNWLFPFVISKLLNDEDVPLTGCGQRYDYLYIDAFARGILKIVEDDATCGIFNFSANSSVELKRLLQILYERIDTKGKLRFGGLPYRDGQVFHMEGNSEKFYSTFGYDYTPDWARYFDTIVEFYKKNRQ